MWKKSLFVILIISLVLALTPNASVQNVNSSCSITNMYACQDNQAHNYAIKSAQQPKTKIGSFTTYFANEQGNRAYNIRLSASKLNGITVASGAKLSFNAVVGARTEENGYRRANVIVGGKYVKGYGGGVCQVSTTLYNAWVLAGLDVEKVQGHSLPSSYVELSRDATVSEHIDLVLLNTSTQSVDISCEVVGGSICINVYGIKGEYDYNIYTEILRVIEPEILPDIEIVVEGEGSDEYEICQGSCGYLSRAVIEVKQQGKLVMRRQLRRDYYMPINSQRIHKIKSHKS